jgi:inosine-uridine nucleoside N-ribohydrolase
MCQDAFAILIAAYHPYMELLGISTVHGNSSLANTTYNALSVLEAIGKSDIPVVPGASQRSADLPLQQKPSMVCVACSQVTKVLILNIICLPRRQWIRRYRAAA